MSAVANSVQASVPVEVLESVELGHREELAKLEMQLVRYRLVLEEHGIDPPDADGEELLAMWRRCSAVISTASEFVASIGSAKEMLSPRWSSAASSASTSK